MTLIVIKFLKIKRSGELKLTLSQVLKKIMKSSEN